MKEKQIIGRTLTKNDILPSIILDYLKNDDWVYLSSNFLSQLRELCYAHYVYLGTMYETDICKLYVQPASNIWQKVSAYKICPSEVLLSASDDPNSIVFLDVE